MSGHLIGCAGTIEDDVRLTPSLKLALLAFADSADDRTHIAFPGYEGVQKWVMCSRGRAAELIKDLVALGYLRQHKKAHRGQRAEYVVFPAGCCDLHRIPVAEPDVDVDELARTAGISVEQARAMLTALAASNGSDAPDTSSGKASGSPDPNGGNGSGGSDPVANGSPIHAQQPVENPGKGPERVHGSRSNANAFTTSERFPPNPAGKPAGGGSCPAHPNGHPNCRLCGTSPRQRAKAAARAKADAERAAQARKRAAERVAAERQAASEATKAAAAGAARKAIAATKTKASTKAREGTR